jgi:adenylate kinase family enzyme
MLGRGASGKSTLGASLGEITGLRVIELDKVFWRPGLVATPRDQWVAVQESLSRKTDRLWMVTSGRMMSLRSGCVAADTIIFLDFSFARCAWRTIRRSRERADFWRWLVKYRRQSRPILMQSIAKHAANADLHVFRNPQALSQFVAKVAWEAGPG